MNRLADTQFRDYKRARGNSSSICHQGNRRFDRGHRDIDSKRMVDTSPSLLVIILFNDGYIFLRDRPRLIVKDEE